MSNLQSSTKMKLCISSLIGGNLHRLVGYAILDWNPELIKLRQDIEWTVHFMYFTTSYVMRTHIWIHLCISTFSSVASLPLLSCSCSYLVSLKLLMRLPTRSWSNIGCLCQCLLNVYVSETIAWNSVIIMWFGVSGIFLSATVRVSCSVSFLCF